MTRAETKAGLPHLSALGGGSTWADSKLVTVIGNGSGLLSPLSGIVGFAQSRSKEPAPALGILGQYRRQKLGTSS